MDAERLEGFDRLQTPAADDDFHAGDTPDLPSVVNLGDILDGSARIELSHAGGEFRSLEEGIEEDSGDEGFDTRAKWVFFLV
jgi:hypothetical protein